MFDKNVFFSKTNVMIKFFQKLVVVRAKKANFFGEINLKIITSAPANIVPIFAAHSIEMEKFLSESDGDSKSDRIFMFVYINDPLRLI
jgi:hypothetical protein